MKAKRVLSDLLKTLGAAIEAFDDADASEVIVPVSTVATSVDRASIEASVKRAQLRKAPAAKAPKPSLIASAEVASPKRPTVVRARKPRTGSGRKGGADIDALELRLVGALEGVAVGLSAESLREAVGVDRGVFATLVRKAKAKNLLRAEGTRRGTVYFAVKPEAASPSVTRVIRRATSEAVKIATPANGVSAVS